MRLSRSVAASGFVAVALSMSATSVAAGTKPRLGDDAGPYCMALYGSAAGQLGAPYCVERIGECRAQQETARGRLLQEWEGLPRATRQACLDEARTRFHALQTRFPEVARRAHLDRAENGYAFDVVEACVAGRAPKQLSADGHAVGLPPRCVATGRVPLPREEMLSIHEICARHSYSGIAGGHCEARERAARAALRAAWGKVTPSLKESCLVRVKRAGAYRERGAYLPSRVLQCVTAALRDWGAGR